jgi:hypothetical protein
MALRRFGYAQPDDDQPIGCWQDDRNDQVAQRDACAAVGAERWAASTRTGENLDASRPSDVVALGGAAGIPATSPDDGAADQDGSAIQAAGGNRAAGQSEAPTPAPSRPSVRYVRARPGDSITRLAGGSDPAVVGAFARLNGMDVRNSTIYAGRVYALPTGNAEATDADAALGNRLLKHDNARIAALRAPGAVSDQFLTRFNAGQNVWTGQPVRTGAPTAPSPTTMPKGQPWWESDPAKYAAATAAYVVGAGAGVPMAVVHTVGDITDAGLFGLQWSGALGPQAQAQANREAAGAAAGAFRYARTAIDDPSKVVSDIRGAAGRAVDNINPFNVDMSGSVQDVLGHEFRHGQNLGEAATNVAGMFAGGEFVQGVRAAKAFEATRAARVAKLVEQGANPKLAEYLAQPYEGMGHHSLFSRRLANKLNLPPWLVDGPINVAKPRGMSRNDFYKYHYQVDPKAGGFRLPADLNGGKGWRPKELGLTKYSRQERIWRGMPVPLKDAMATLPFADAPALYDHLERPQ